jgi:thioesterase domain-containing protein
MLINLEDKLHSQIPMTKLMKLRVKSLDKEKLVTTAPLDININDKGTAFGGSLSTMTIISSWSVCLLFTEQLGFDNSMIAIIKNETSYKVPVTKDIVCHTFLPSKEEIDIFEKKLKEKQSASLKIRSQIIENNKVCVDFNGLYVIKV